MKGRLGLSFNRTSQVFWFRNSKVEYSTDNRDTLDRYQPGLPIYASLVKWYNYGFVLRRSEFDSQRGHQFLEDSHNGIAAAC